MDPSYYKALSLFRLRKYEKCIEMCNQLLGQSPQLQGPWELKMRAMTQRVYVDDIEAEDDGVVGERDDFNSSIISKFICYNLQTIRWTQRSSRQQPSPAHPCEQRQPSRPDRRQRQRDRAPQLVDRSRASHDPAQCSSAQERHR
jgi:hypothetical protein